jgi:hypothetical protein
MGCKVDQFAVLEPIKELVPHLGALALAPKRSSSSATEVFWLRTGGFVAPESVLFEGQLAGSLPVWAYAWTGSFH